MATANPFNGFDFAKFAGDFKVPTFDVDKFVAAQKKNVETLTTANKLAAESAQELFQRQSSIARESAEELTAAVQELLAVGEPKDKMARQIEIAREGYERGFANFTEMTNAATKANKQVFDMLSKRFVESLTEAQGFVKTPSK